MPRLEGTNPISGESVNLLNWRVWLSYLLGFGFIVLIFNSGKSLWASLTGKVPMLGRFGSDIPLLDEPTPVIMGDIRRGPVIDYGEAV